MKWSTLKKYRGDDNSTMLKPTQTESISLATLGLLIVVLALYEMLRQSKDLTHKEFIGSLKNNAIIHSCIFGFVLALVHIVITNLLVDHWHKILSEDLIQTPVKRVVSANTITLALSVAFARLVSELLDLKYPCDGQRFLFGDAFGVILGGIVGLVLTQTINFS